MAKAAILKTIVIIIYVGTDIYRMQAAFGRNARSLT